MIGYFTSGNDLPETMDMSSNLGKLCNVIEFTIGSDQEYLSDYIGPVEINELEKGSSILIGAPVGCGKTTALIRAAKNYRASLKTPFEKKQLCTTSISSTSLGVRKHAFGRFPCSCHTYLLFL